MLPICPTKMTRPSPHIAVIGAGIGGVSTALRLAHAGARVSVFERHGGPGGKMRTFPSVAGPVDAGPTVLTMKHVFEDLFADTGSALSNHVTLTKEDLLARHFWPDGTTLDLMSDSAASEAAVCATFGKTAAAEFAAFQRRTERLFQAFDAPMMQTAAPSLMSLTALMMRKPTLIPAMAPHQTMAEALSHQFSDPKLQQLFGRYATYVGGRPDASPALLSLIWQAEQQGVWHVTGGMHELAKAIAARAETLGARFHYNAHVTGIDVTGDRPTALRTEDGRIDIDAVCFNGDPRALAIGMLGEEVSTAVGSAAISPRSLSACVHSFAATAHGVDLAAHNVFFCDDPATEFGPIAAGTLPCDATLYVCAQDRFNGGTPKGPERFEIIMNAPAVADRTALTAQEKTRCHLQIMDQLATFGLRFDPMPAIDTLTMPQHFSALFPASNGALYGRSPHGMMAAFKRPRVRSRMKGLYLVGGGVHPGAGIPMATLCARHAAAAMIKDLRLTSTPRQADMPGGTSTASQTMAPAPSRSSVS